ncbi:MAG: helicase [Gammaproteobacteria bacterium]|nr:helicase [Gammaproteobacteria bacterium]
MLKFKFLLWMLAKLLKKAAKNNPACAEYIEGKDVVFQIQTESGSGRNFTVKDGKVSSSAGLTKEPTFTLCFKDAATGLAILTAKDKNAFMAGIQNKDLVISGNFAEVMWFQGLTKFLKPSKKK